MDKLKCVALVVSLIMLNIALAGCFEEEEKKKSIEIKMVGKGHKIYTGDSTTYILLVTNNRNQNDTVTLTVASQPTGWVVTLNQTEINLSKKGSMGIFVMINATSDAKMGDHKIEVHATSKLDGKKYSKSFKVKVIGPSDTTARVGDKVEVDYIGYLTSYEIFDTSIEDIATNTAIRKQLGYPTRGGYQPLKVYVGPEDPDPQDQYTSTVEGFWEAIEGMSVGQSRTVILPPSKAYGQYENATLNVTEDVFILETMSFSDFDLNFGETPREGMFLEHYFWGWNVSIDYVNQTEDTIIVRNEPYINQIVTSYGWDSKVIYKNQSDNGGKGSIHVEHHTQKGAEGIYENHSAIVKTIEDDQIKLEYNVSTHNLGNEILIFDITLIDILD
ncbi:MAG: FKBP-type peptidyl-prolyl cis-trans isomerase [Thermoplasmata archaeon]|nr:MAG: FKBP-type peptidyl-prolyl cis-trans isomerase [Thermoplasmata archaeon]